MHWAWYLPNDMQYFFLIPIIVYLLYHKRAFGFAFIAFYQTLCFVITIFYANKYNLEVSAKRSTDHYNEYFYRTAYSRIAPFTIGVFVALLLYSFKNESEDESILKRWMDKINSSLLIR